MSYPPVVSSTVYAAVPGDTAEVWDPSPPEPPPHLDERIPCSHYDVVHATAAWPRCSCDTTGACPDATRKHGDAHN